MWNWKASLVKPLRRNIVVDWCFDNLTGRHFQGQKSTSLWLDFDVWPWKCFPVKWSQWQREDSIRSTKVSNWKFYLLSVVLRHQSLRALRDLQRLTVYFQLLYPFKMTRIQSPFQLRERWQGLKKLEYSVDSPHPLNLRSMPFPSSQMHGQT